MKELVRHLVRNNLQQIVDRSLLNCHVVGLHSIMLLESPGKTIRLFYADENHELYKNDVVNYPYLDTLSVAVHPHHCNVTLHCIKGSLTNFEFEQFPKSTGICTPVNKWVYQSQITNGETIFSLEGMERLVLTKNFLFTKGSVRQMQANQLHTVWVNRGVEAAWLVYEGAEDPTYIPYCWSNVELDKCDFSNLYQKMPEHQVLNILNKAGFYNLR
jgi:hypothetical protein